MLVYSLIGTPHNYTVGVPPLRSSSSRDRLPERLRLHTSSR